MTKVARWITALLFVVGTAPANASLMGFNFDYTFTSNEILSGMLLGELQSDGDTILVDSVSMVSYTGIPGLELHETLISPNPTASLSGLVMELVSQIPVGQAGWLLITTGSLGPAQARVSLPILQDEENEVFSANRWNISAKVPAPATTFLILVGLGFLNVRRGSGREYRHLNHIQVAANRQ